jgi:hypothetical protein
VPDVPMNTTVQAVPLKVSTVFCTGVLTHDDARTPSMAVRLQVDFGRNVRDINTLVCLSPDQVMTDQFATAAELACLAAKRCKFLDPPLVVKSA